MVNWIGNRERRYGTSWDCCQIFGCASLLANAAAATTLYTIFFATRKRKEGIVVGMTPPEEVEAFSEEVVVEVGSRSHKLLPGSSWWLQVFSFESKQLT